MSGQRVGYTRVSSLDQNADRQLDGVALDRVFTDSASGRSTARPQLEALLAFVRDGDTVLVHSMDRLARNLDDLRALVRTLTARGVRVQFAKEQLTFTGDDTAAERPESAAPAGREPATTSGGGVAPDAGGKQVRGFRVVHVFALHQTEGAPLPEVAPALLTGQAPAGLWNELASQVTGYGYALERGDCCGANGYTDRTRRVVRVRDDVDDAQALKTLAHELGHLECGHVTDLPTYLTCRGRCEVEAESVAYVVAAAHGLDASGYTFAYVAGWAGPDLTCVRQAAETVTKAARTILGRCNANTATGSDDLADTA